MNLQHKLRNLTPADVVSTLGVIALCAAMIVAAILVEPAPGYYCSGGSCTSKADVIGAIFGLHESHTVITSYAALHACQGVAVVALVAIGAAKLMRRTAAPATSRGSARR